MPNNKYYKALISEVNKLWLIKFIKFGNKRKKVMMFYIRKYAISEEE